MGLKHICVAATTVALASSSSTAAATKGDGAAFLETFDDGLKGWVKSEVEQYTGAFCLFISSLVVANAIGRGGVSLSLSLFLSAEQSSGSSSSSRTRRMRVREFPIGKIENARSRGKKKIKAAKARESLPPHLSRKLARRRENEKETKTRVFCGSLSAARELVYRAVSFSLLPFTHTSVFLCFLLFFPFCRRG